MLAVDTVSFTKVKDILNSTKYTQEKTKLLRENLARILAPYIFVGNANYTYTQVPSIRNVCHNSDIPCKSDPFCSNNGSNCLLYVNKNEYGSIIKKLALDVLTSNEILNNTVRKEFLTSENFVKRANEVILFTEKQIKDYFE